MRKTLLLLLIIFFWFLPPVQAEIKTFIHTVRQPFSGSQSPDDARVAATHKAKREVLEKAGTYLESLTIVEEGRLTKDQVLALTSGVLKTEIVSQKHYYTEEGFGIIIKARVRVHTGVLEDRVKKLIIDRTTMKQLTTIRKREKELLDKIERLEEVNRRLTKKIETQIVKKEKEALKKDFQQTTKGLDAVTLIGQAWEDVKDSNPRRAIELLDKAIELDPGNAMAYRFRGTAYSDLNQPVKAIQDYSKAIELDPGNSYAYIKRGLEYRDLKQYDRAIQNFDKVIELDPDNKGTYLVRGWLYMTLQKVSRGCADLKKACELGTCFALESYIKNGYCL